MKRQPAKWKIEKVEEIAKLLKESQVIGVVDLRDLPSSQLQNMRMKLKDAKLLMTRKKLMLMAIEKSGVSSLINLKEYLENIVPALIISNRDAFKLYKIIKQSKTPAPIKAGQVSPKNITINAGPTSFSPGPIIGELGQLKIKAGIENGKVVIKESTVLVKKGEKVNSKQASILLRLGIQPIEIGLNILGIYEKGTIFDKKVLDIDENKLLKDISTASNYGLRLAIGIGYPTKESINHLIKRAYIEALILALEKNVITKETINEILNKAYATASILKEKTNV